MANNNDPVILSEEPKSVKININDPNKPRQNAGGKMIKKPQKIPWYDRLISGLFGSEVNHENIGEYFLNEVAVPTGKRLLNNGIQSGLKRASDASQVLIFGRVINQSNGPTDYTSFSNPNVAQKPSGFRVMDQVDVFAFTYKNHAEECLTYLRGRIQTYGSTSVIDYYEWINSHIEGVNIPLDYNLTYRGWMDLNNVTITPDPNGWIINLPRPVALKRG